MGSRSEEGVFEDHGGQIVARSQINKDGNIAISEGADEVYFVLLWSEGIPFSVETCESFLSVDGCHESAVLITCEFIRMSKKRNCIVLFKFNGKFNIAMTDVQIMQKLICTVLVVKHGERVINVPIPK